MVMEKKINIRSRRKGNLSTRIKLKEQEGKLMIFKESINVERNSVDVNMEHMRLCCSTLRSNILSPMSSIVEFFIFLTTCFDFI